MQKNVLVVFSPKNLINHLETRTNFPRNLKEKYLALISKVQNTCAKEKIDNFLPKNVFLILYFNREIFRIWAKISDKNCFRHFSCPGVLLVLFAKDIGISLDCELKCYSFGRQVFNRFFGSALKMRTTAYLFFLDSLKFFFFIAVSWAENFQTLRKTSLKKSSVFPFPCAEDNWYFFYPKK